MSQRVHIVIAYFKISIKQRFILHFILNMFSNINDYLCDMIHFVESVLLIKYRFKLINCDDLQLLRYVSERAER